MKQLFLIVGYLCAANGGTITGISKMIERTPTGFTIYTTSINNHPVYCRMMKRNYGCYNLSECEDNNNYLCAHNVEIKVDK